MKYLADINVNIGEKFGLSDPTLGRLADQSTYNIPSLISVGVRLILIFGIVAAFIFLLIGAVQWITAGGEKEGIEKAKKKISGAIVGLVIGLSVFAILRVVKVIFGIDILGDIKIPSI